MLARDQRRDSTQQTSNLNISDLFQLHRLVYQYLGKLITALLREKKKEKQDMGNKQKWKAATVHHHAKGLFDTEQDRIIQILKDIGPPPSQTRRDKKGN